jgi:hypothetical protein
VSLAQVQVAAVRCAEMKEKAFRVPNGIAEGELLHIVEPVNPEALVRFPLFLPLSGAAWSS